MDRRKFVKGLVLCGLTLTTLPSLVGCAQQGRRYISAASNHAGQHFVVAFDESGLILSQVEIANRGHDLIALDEQRVVAFSRRPFTKLFIVHLANSQLEQTIDAEPGFHFYGHGVFERKRNWLITTENHIASGNGYLVVRDATNFTVIKRIPSGGIGPHQCALMPNGQQLVVANGGIKTHPNHGRSKLNLATMRPNLAYIALDSDEIVEIVEPLHQHLSLRHLAVSSDGQVIVAAQYQGHYRDQHPLVFSHRQGGQLTPLQGDAKFWQQFNHYIASVMISEQTNQLAVTSPRGAQVAYWQLSTHQLLGMQRFADCAGVAPSKNGFLITNGKGQAVTEDTANHLLFQAENLKFDNHLSYI